MGFFKVNMGVVDVGGEDETDFLAWRGRRGHALENTEGLLNGEKFLLRTRKRRLSAMGALLRSVTEDAVVARTGREFHTKRL